MNDDLELTSVIPAARDNNNQKSAAGEGSVIGVCPEASALLSAAQGAERQDAGGAAASHTHEEAGASRWWAELRRELKTPLLGKIRLWMLILIVFIIITLLFFITTIVCSVGFEDADEEFDKSTFVVKHLFRGNFSVDSNNNNSSSYVSEELEKKLTGVYSSSAALRWYFSNISIISLSNSTAEFRLWFMMPEEHEELRRFTLSGEMVQSVLLQHLYQQDQQPYITPASLHFHH